MPSIFLILAMIFLIAGLISLSSQLAIGLASSAETVATVAIAAVVVAASRGGRLPTDREFLRLRLFELDALTLAQDLAFLALGLRLRDLSAFNFWERRLP